MAANLSGKVALISGSSSGIGQGIAVHFAKLGCFVAVTGRDVSRLSETKQICVQNGLAEDKILTVAAELTEEADLDNLVNKTVAHFGKLDILVNNAATGTKEGSILRPIEEYDSTMATNVRSTILLTQKCIPHLEKTQGSIIFISSLASIRAAPAATFYCASKAALDHLARCVALELAPKKIRVNIVNPGYTVTPGFARAGFSDSVVQMIEKKVTETYPLGRVGQSEDVAQAVAFLVSDNASFITGQSMFVDGGKNISSSMAASGAAAKMLSA